MLHNCFGCRIAIVVLLLCDRRGPSIEPQTI